MIEFLEDIEKHFKECYPREGCGLLGVVKGKLKWFPCTNVAVDEDDFIIDSKEFIDISRRADITSVVHSHPDASNEPSEYDKISCNATGLPYHIFSYPEMELYTLNPEKVKKPLHGRLYKFGENDCLEAGLDYYKTQNINLPKRIPFEDNWWKKGLDYFNDDYIKTWGFEKVTDSTMIKNDLLIFAVYSEVGNHCGVYLGNDIFFHHAENRLSCRENLYPSWMKHLIGVYRYAS